ncbi:MAG TPA: methyltransferase, partial [Candidatus Lokiarchaeia archaeon]|nr:methyltransferase [Candidatus Lokiarchaeia archaeon]
LDGSSPFTWRQGLKHDAAKVMVLDPISNSMFINGLGEQVELEQDLLFPFVKGSALARTRVLQDSPKRVIMTQTKLGEDTTAIADSSPLLWDYLVSHGKILDARKSSMYFGKPRFSIFGVGPYAFLPYKVGIASFYKVPAFTLVLPDHGKPTMLDDTSYFLGFEELMPAFFTWVALNLPQVQVFLQAIAFIDAKRPYTKDILMRLDLDQLLSDVPYAIISEFYESSLKDVLDLHFTEGEWDHFRGTLESPTRCLKVKNQN